MPLIERLPALIRTAQQLATLQGASLVAKVLGEARSNLVLSGYDNWDGGTDLYTLVLEIPLATYVEVVQEQESLETSIKDRIGLQTRMEINESVAEVVISPLSVDETIPGPPSFGEPTGDEDYEPVPAFWQPGYFRLFISHLAAEKTAAHALKDALARYQVAAFVAHDDIEPTTEWQNEIESALRTMDAMTVMLSPGFIESPWCDQEVGYALGRKRFVLGLRMGANPHGFLGKFQGLQVAGLEPSTTADLIFDILIRHEATTQRMTESLVERLVRSSSWKSSKRNISLLERASFLNSGQSARLLTAIDRNVDVGEAYGVPDKIRSLIRRIGESCPTEGQPDSLR